MDSKRKKSKYFPKNATDKRLKGNIKKSMIENWKENEQCYTSTVKLDKRFFEKYSTLEFSKKLLGKLLCRRVDNTIVKGMIVETEAYLGPEDHASYSFGGRRTEGNEPMYMPASTCFVRMTYGMYYCFNISTRDEGGAVLIRAVEPLEGIKKMIELRTKHPKAPVKSNFVEKLHLITNGPSKFCIAFGIDKSLNRSNLLTDPNIWLEDFKEFSDSDIVKSTRVGISNKNPSANKMLRFYLKNFKSVSKL